MTVSPEVCARVSGAIIGCGVLVSSLGQLSARRNLAGGGFYDWAVVRTRKGWTTTGVTARRLDVLFAYPRVLSLTVLQALAAVALVVGYPAGAAAGVLLVLIGTQALLRLRLQWGTDGADQVTFIVLAGLFVFYLAPPGALRSAALVFIGAETILCYFAAGLAKLLDPLWRDGAAVPMIVRSREFGLVRLSAVLDRHAPLGRLVCWSTIAWETSAPLFVLLGPRTCIAYMAVGAVFHLSVAAVMGLNDFVLGFVSTYPALFYLSTLVPHP